MVVLGSSVAGARTASSEQLIVPFTCQMQGNEPRLTMAPETTYAIYGIRHEQPFSSCGAGANGSCVTMMVHSFTIGCAGKRLPWSRFAAAAREHGIKLPAGLPVGYAPVSSLAGRFVLPSLTKSTSNSALMSVATQDLSPDSVVEAPYHGAKSGHGHPAWQTIVRADSMPTAESGLGRVAGTVATLLMLLTAVSLVAAGRWRGIRQWPSFLAVASGPTRRRIGRRLKFGLNNYVRDAIATAYRAANASFNAWQQRESANPQDKLSNAAHILQARLAETDLLVATLADGLLLRDVLQAEIDQVRDRGMETEKNLRRRDPEKTAAAFRTLLRELDRISRIAQGATQTTQPAVEAEYAQRSVDMPRNANEAYRLLGLNADAPPAVAKKLVDALRMTWHPDYARDDGDRNRREDRMKQINAAWDMIKHRRAAA